MTTLLTAILNFIFRLHFYRIFQIKSKIRCQLTPVNKKVILPEIYTLQSVFHGILIFLANFFILEIKVFDLKDNGRVVNIQTQLFY